MMTHLLEENIVYCFCMVWDSILLQPLERRDDLNWSLRTVGGVSDWIVT